MSKPSSEIDQLVKLVKGKRLHKNVGRTYRLPLIVAGSGKSMFSQKIFNVKILNDGKIKISGGGVNKTVSI